MHDDNHNTAHGDQDDARIQALLKDYPMPQAAAGFYDQALARATVKGARRERNRWLLSGFGGAIAAGLALWLLSSTLLHTPGMQSAGDTVSASIPGITMTLEEPRTVNLVFASATALDAVTLTVTLPAGVELAGFPGQSEVSWETSLTAGRNLLPLRLVALTPVGGELLARLEHENRDRLFRLRLNIS
ncbi:MAG: hypothetical protein OEW64_11995 [Gammaproteobacteria bacterium]|nr:hypothetical protein [Gammaproteobacteria bacterium]MDH5304801.1 hypothetical protein [Gammaproteobacteria bacterium]MDH5322690.1 hypothetical protein [Gammaproteobacteria bacterium]